MAARELDVAQVHDFCRRYQEDRLLNLAVVRLLEIVGQAAARIPHELRASFPEIPWSSIVGLRNRLIHGYHAVDLGIVWLVIEEEMPGFVALFERVASDLRSTDS